ncbi:hypothetical protein H6F89_06075 [Cyanobacteria bacterium FACHB-63]|nr:hypothetical protein [Cyanobacteria bacterium FACHB-63]
MPQHSFLDRSTSLNHENRRSNEYREQTVCPLHKNLMAIVTLEISPELEQPLRVEAAKQELDTTWQVTRVEKIPISSVKELQNLRSQ